MRGIAIMGLNGCGKSTLAHALAQRLGLYELDVEDYYFPEQRLARRAALEGRPEACCERSGSLPYARPRDRREVQEMIASDIERHPRVVICGVTMNWDARILSAIDVAFMLEVPAEERVRRVSQREQFRFGARVMPGGDMYEQQQAFRELIAHKSHRLVEESAARMPCRRIRLDGTRRIDENVDIILGTLAEMGKLSD